MKFLFVVLALLAAAPLVRSAPAPAGKALIPLATVAERLAAGLTAEPRNGFVTLTTPRCQIVFVPDVRRIAVNGLGVHLNAPYVLRGGAGYIALADARTVLEPLLDPRARAVPLPSRPIVVIDPGHGGEDSGAVGVGRATEKHLVLQLARETVALLRDTGLDVRLTRDADIFLGLDERADLANRWGADLFVSLHANSSANARAEGVETYVLSAAGFASTAEGSRADGAYPNNAFDAENSRLGYLLQKGLIFHTQAEDRGVRRARFEVLRRTRCPAALIECGFLTNPDESWLLRKPDYRLRVAQGVVSGMLTYLHQRDLVTRDLPGKLPPPPPVPGPNAAPPAPAADAEPPAAPAVPVPAPRNVKPAPAPAPAPATDFPAVALPPPAAPTDAPAQPVVLAPSEVRRLE